MAKGCVVVGGVGGSDDGVTATMVYLGHAIDFHVGLAIYLVVASGKKWNEVPSKSRRKVFPKSGAIYAIEFDVYE